VLSIPVCARFEVVLFMRMSQTDRHLGMSCPIARRDFLNGVLMSGVAGGVRVAGAAEGGFVPPPYRTGMRGSHPGAFETAHALRDGVLHPHDVVETGEIYDLVVVGGGLSGLAAAHFFRKYAGADKSVLIIENHDDFGGHAKRNSFVVEGRELALNGGTLEIESPQRYNEWALMVLRDIGVDLAAYRRENAPEAGLYERMGLKEGLFFDRETWTRDVLLRPRGASGGEHWRGLGAADLADAPMSAAARADWVRLNAAVQPDYLAGRTVSEKKRFLATVSYTEYLLKVAKVDPSVAWVFRKAGSGVFCVGADALPALFAFTMGLPGFSGLGLGAVPGGLLSDLPGGQHGRQVDSDETVHFPDGNATLARLLVASLVPGVTDARTQDGMGTARFDYAALDRPGQAVRVRLGTMALNVAHDGMPGTAETVSVVCAAAGEAKPGRFARVRGRQVVMAGWNMFVPYLVPSLPAAQKEALAYGVKGPLVYTNVALRNWRAFRALGVSDIQCPGMFFEQIQLAEPASLGGLRAPVDPEGPIVVRMIKTMGVPGEGMSARDQHRAGRGVLLATSFETFEREVRAQLQRVLGPGGFDAARDIAAITVNRWPHGYAYTYNSLFDPMEWVFTETEARPCVVGRQPFGRIAIANSDAAASPHTDAAFQEAHRAVVELLDRGAYPFVSPVPGASAP